MAVFNEMQKLILFSHSSNVFIVDLAFRSDVFVDKLFNCNCKIIHFMSFPAHLLIVELQKTPIYSMESDFFE